jgi:sugar lactone lactonase YvrE
VEIQLVTASLTTLGESPIWDANEGRLYWVDVMEGNVLSSTPDGLRITVTQFPGHVTSIALRAEGGAVVTSGNGIYLFDLETGETELVFDSGCGPGFSFNDGTVDRQGRFVTGLVDQSLVAPGSTDFIAQSNPGGRLYRLDHDLTVQPIAEGIGITNGPCFSPDGSTFYCNDSWARCVYMFDYDIEAGAASNRQVLTGFDGDVAVPDGATVDSEGCLWIAAFRGGEIRSYAPDGTLERRISTPVASPTSVAFGGPSLDILFVTSQGSAHVPGHPSQPGPLAGSLLAVHGLGVRGIAEKRFGESGS